MSRRSTIVLALTALTWTAAAWAQPSRTSSTAVSADAGVARRDAGPKVEVAPPPPPKPPPPEPPPPEPPPPEPPPPEPPPPEHRVRGPSKPVTPPTPDGGVRDAGTMHAVFTGPIQGPPAAPPRSGASGSHVADGIIDGIARMLDAQLALLQLLLGAFVIFRILAWVARRAARAQNALAMRILPLWVFVEAAGWFLIAGWVAMQFGKTETAATAGLAVLVALVVIALSWGAIKDVVAGLMIAAERPFEVGDHVTVGDLSGQVVGFRVRVLELQTDQGHRIRVPYRDVGGATDVRAGGRRTAHAVSLTFELPDSMDAAEALSTAKELAASSPWAVLGVQPRLTLNQQGERAIIEMEAYTFDRETGPLLHADLLSGWQKLLKR